VVLFPGKLIYLALPHTASMVTVQTLVTLEGALGQEVTRVNHHATRAEARVKRPDLFSGDEVAVSVVRHPCDLLVTWWLRHLIRLSTHKKSPRPPTFEHFLKMPEEEISAYSPSYLKAGRMYWMDADEYLRYENLQEELNRTLNRFDLPSVALPRRNVTRNKRPWQEYYDEDVFAAVRERFGDEAERFGYQIP
jgi:hypothetical protein